MALWAVLAFCRHILLRDSLLRDVKRLLNEQRHNYWQQHTSARNYDGQHRGLRQRSPTVPTLDGIKMACEKIGEPVKSAISEPCDFHHALFAGDNIWLFGKKFVSQPSHNWGHRVALAGTYGVAFNLANKKWEEPHKFPPLSQEENVSEILFVLNKAIYILLFSAFGELSMKSAHKWTGEAWEPLKLESFPAIAAGDPSERVTMAIADGAHENSKYLVSTVGRQIRVAQLKLSDSGIAISQVLDVPDDAAISGAQAVSAVETAERLLISYGVHGCGFRWEKGRFIACDLNKKACEALQISSDAGPRWGFSGALAQYLAPSGAWVHVAGKIPSGMTGSVFDGSIWALTNLSSTPLWHQLKGNVPAEGDVVVGQGRIISIDKDGVHSQQLTEN